MRPLRKRACSSGRSSFSSWMTTSMENEVGIFPSPRMKASALRVAVGAEERALAVHRAAGRRERLADLQQAGEPGDLVEDVGAQLAVDQARDEIVVGQIITDVAEAHGDEVGEQVEHQHGLAELRAAAQRERGVRLARGQQGVELLHDGQQRLAPAKVVGDVARAAFHPGVVGEEIEEGGDDGDGGAVFCGARVCSRP